MGRGMKVSPLAIPDVFLIELSAHEDERGFFVETYQVRQYEEAGIHGPFVQDNHSRSRRGVLRGLHYQIRQPQGKLVRVVAGRVFDVAVDLRRSSPTLGKWVGIELAAGEPRQLWIPAGFAHGFYVLSEWAEVVYKVTDYYAPQSERTLLWDDPRLGIEWPLVDGRPPLLSEKDAAGLPLAEAELFA